MEYKLTFTEKTTSPSLEDAIELARAMPHYEQQVEKHIVTVNESELDENFCELIQMTGHWSTTRVEVDGKKIRYKELRGITCHYEREGDCDGICKWLEYGDIGVRGLFNREGFFGQKIVITCGTFDKRGVFHVDKEKIRKNVESRLKEYKYCPILDRRKIETKINELPSSINLSIDSEWGFDDFYGGVVKELGPQIPEALLEERKATLAIQEEEARVEMIKTLAQSLKPAIKEAFVEAMSEILAKEGKTAKKIFLPKRGMKK